MGWYCWGECCSIGCVEMGYGIWIQVFGIAGSGIVEIVWRLGMEYRQHVDMTIDLSQHRVRIIGLIDGKCGMGY